jgi:hypothetical protein
MLEVVIDDPVIEPVLLGHLPRRRLQALADPLLALRASPPQSPLEFLRRGRRQEDEDGVGVGVADLPGSLDVDR